MTSRQPDGNYGLRARQNARANPRGNSQRGGDNLDDFQYTAARLKVEIENKMSGISGQASGKPKSDADGFEEVELKLRLFNDVIHKIENRMKAEAMSSSQTLIWNRRVKNYQNSSLHFQQKVQTLKNKADRKAIEDDHRDQLFGYYKQKQMELATVFNNFEEENKSLNRSDTMMNETLQIASATIEELRNQGKTLMNSETRLSDMLGRMNVVSSLLKVINRKEKGNKLIVFGGMAAVFILVFLAFLMFR